MNYSADQVIDALYRAALNREADRDGLTAYGEVLERYPHELPRVASAFFESEEHSTIMGRPNGLRDHSQHGEFPKLLGLLLKSGSRHQQMVDVGARGRDRSNSYDLASHFGWKTLLVEANPHLYESIHREFAGLDYALIECAVGPEEGILPFYLGANDDVSSLNIDAASGWGELRGRINVPVRRLPPLLFEQQVPTDFDVLSLDIEGMDIAVLNDLIDTSPYRPSLIVVEVPHREDISELAEVAASARVCEDYRIVDRTRANLILARR